MTAPIEKQKQFVLENRGTNIENMRTARHLLVRVLWFGFVFVPGPRKPPTQGSSTERDSMITTKLSTIPSIHGVMSVLSCPLFLVTIGNLDHMTAIVSSSRLQPSRCV